MNLLRDQSAALRAHSPLAYLSGMSRGSLRGALQLDLLATVPVRITLLFVVLLLSMTPSWAGSLAPKLDIGLGGQCVDDPKFMRKNHMEMLKHQRDETVRQGIRGGKYSLVECVNCHASKKDNNVLGSNDHFCQGCHAYAEVKIDCFECHSSKRKVVAEAAK